MQMSPQPEMYPNQEMHKSKEHARMGQHKGMISFSAEHLQNEKEFQKIQDEIANHYYR